MTPQQVLEKYGSQYRFQKETGMSHRCLGRWLKDGKVPETSQYKLETITGGSLKSDLTLKREQQNA